MIKRFFVFITILILSFSVFVIPVNAESDGIDLDCVREKLLNGEDTSQCEGVGGGGTSQDIDTNFFGITFTPDQAGAAKIVRTFMTIALGALVLGTIFYGIYGIYVRSTAGADENKIKESVAIFKNAMLAILITVGALVLVQILSIFLGLGNVWEFTFSNEAGQEAPAGKFDGCPAATEGAQCLVNDGTEDAVRMCRYQFVSGRWVKTSAACIE